VCLICVEFQKGLLTPNEAWRNFQEMQEGLTDEHQDEVVNMIVESVLNKEGEDLDEEDVVNNLSNVSAPQMSFDWEEDPYSLEFDDEYDDHYDPWDQNNY